MRSVQIYENSSFFGIFSRLGHFPQVFGQFKECLILELHKMGKVPNVAASSVDFNLLCCREISREEYSNLWKMINYFFDIFSHSGHFFHVFGYVKQWLIY